MRGFGGKAPNNKWRGGLGGKCPPVIERPRRVRLNPRPNTQQLPASRRDNSKPTAQQQILRKLGLQMQGVPKM